MVYVRVSCCNCPYECENKEQGNWFKYFDPCSFKHQTICDHDMIMELLDIIENKIEEHKLVHAFYNVIE